MKHKISILIVEPSDIVREGLSSLLDDGFSLLTPMREVGTDLPQRIGRLQPDILLVNPTLFPAPAGKYLTALAQARPSMTVVALVYQYVEPRLLQGFKAVLDIREPGSHVSQLLRECCQTGGDATEENYELSDRESEVLVMVSQGLSSKEIADQLNISVHTVNTHRKNITRKTGIRSVAGLTVYALLHNLRVKNEKE